MHGGCSFAPPAFTAHLRSPVMSEVSTRGSLVGGSSSWRVEGPAILSAGAGSSLVPHASSWRDRCPAMTGASDGGSLVPATGLHMPGVRRYRACAPARKVLVKVVLEKVRGGSRVRLCGRTRPARWRLRSCDRGCSHGQRLACTWVHVASQRGGSEWRWGQSFASPLLILLVLIF